MKMLSRSSHDSSFSFSRRFNWGKKLDHEDDNDEEVILKSIPREDDHLESAMAIVPRRHKNKKKSAVSKIRSAFTSHSATSTKVVGTLFGYRRSHVNFAFQTDPRSAPEFLIELEATTSVLVREMASGLVRIALECDRKQQQVIPNRKKTSRKLLEEPVWKTYCNGRKCGLGVRRDLGLEDSRVLRALEPVSMGAGVLPAGEDYDDDCGELMYMRARFERVIGSRDSEAFYMMNPDGSGGPELSVYLLRV